ncbi:MAG: 50S ribosomal protein L7/L12 [Rhabdochlamydiaceae bacterium]
MSRTLDQIAEDLSGLSVLDMSKLKAMLEEKWGVKAAAGAPMMMAAPAAGGGADAAPAAESTEFEVTLHETPADKKIGAIKFVREITGLGLKEAKDLVDGAPKVLKPSCSKADADAIAKKAAEASVKVTVKGL